MKRVVSLLLLLPVMAAAQQNNPDRAEHIELGLGFEQTGTDLLINSVDYRKFDVAGLKLYANYLDPVSDRLTFITSVEWLPDSQGTGYELFGSTIEESTRRFSIMFGLRMYFSGESDRP